MSQRTTRRTSPPASKSTNGEERRGKKTKKRSLSDDRTPGPDGVAPALKENGSKREISAIRGRYRV